MKRSVAKREEESIGDQSGRRQADKSSEKLKIAKKERHIESDFGSVRLTEPLIQDDEQEITDRRAIRSQYLALTHRIKDAKDDLSKIDSDKFKRIINEVENLHNKVQKPREQIRDAEALLDLASSVVSSVKSQSTNGGVSPAEFVNALINGFGKTSSRFDSDENTKVVINWKDIGFHVCSTLLVSCGYTTMIGPMDTYLKQRKRNIKRRKHCADVKPEEVDDTEGEKKTDTDNNMAIMFGILRKYKRVKIENLVLNRISFAQTVENVFALSFLVKDGRVEIIVDDNGSHFVVPRNAPAANLLMSGEVAYNHFVFRFDYKDWKLMSTMVAMGEELMPHRETEVAQVSNEAQIRKLTKKQGLVIKDETVVDDSSNVEGDNVDRNNGTAPRRFF